MNTSEYWKNFALGDELSIAGTFIYNGLRQFNDMKNLNYTDEIFETLYSLSVGIERVLKIAVVLLEHEDGIDQAAFEKSLYTHGHTGLLQRVTAICPLKLAEQHLAILGLLESFYANHRYDRFSMTSVHDLAKEQDSLFRLLNRQIGTYLKRDASMFATENKIQYRKHLSTLVLAIARELYEVISHRAHELNIYIYELRTDSKASSVFQRDPKTLFLLEDLAWKELLIFLINTDAETGTIDFLRGVEPLDLDSGLIPEYLENFGSRPPIGSLIDEIDERYNERSDQKARLKTMGLIGNPGVDFDMSDDAEFSDNNEFDVVS